MKLQESMPASAVRPLELARRSRWSLRTWLRLAAAGARSARGASRLPRVAGSRLPLVALGLLVFLADQISKGWAQGLPEQLPFVVLPNVMQVVRVENPGIAFSLLSNVGAAWRMGLVSVSGLVLVVVAWLIFRRPVGRSTGAGLMMILGGAAGNLMDRVLFGRVTDFLQITAGQHQGPVFNLADMAITVGAAMLIWAILRERLPVEAEPSAAGDV